MSILISAIAALCIALLARQAMLTEILARQRAAELEEWEEEWIN